MKIKKVLKIILAIIVIALLVIIGLKAYSQKIIFDIMNSMKNYNSGKFAYREIEEHSIAESSEKIYYVTEYIKNENIYVVKNDYNNYISVEWLDLKNTNEFYNHCKYHYYNELDNNNNNNTIWYDIQTLEEIQHKMEYSIPQIYASDIRENLKYFESCSFFEKIQIIATLPIIYTQNYEGKDCYVLSDNSWGKTYIDKETLLPVATISENFSDKFEYNIEYDEKILQEPDINQFANIEYYDSFNRNKAGLIVYDEYSENSITGTTLDPKETLIENVELKEDEKLDILPLTENDFGIKSVKVDSLELYTRLRNHYTNLRELTEEDLMYYSATIIYKNNYKLTYMDTKEAIDSFNGHYIFNEEQSENNSIVLLMRPRARYGSKHFVISNEQLRIPVSQIQETYFAISNEIEENLGLDKDILYCNTAKIVRLNNENYKEFDYIKIPIQEGIEPICWEIEADINVRTERYGEVYTYINAITGEVIGARYIRNNN